MSFKYPFVPPFFLVPFAYFPSIPLSSHNPTPLYLPFPPSIGLIISLQLLRGELEQIKRENQAVFNRALALTRKLGFPDVILPGKEAKSSRR